ncbi:thiol peroxidase [Tenacibaculum sp. SG-28]|uniref:thiol peroxidase n=1 Tax=Tenacibaculum sp. SG-28 TaxID=754426 RepID=UPI000CF4ECEB|nr:thiol peroxidase [Tenacibaculum sp. SG-28]PQJ23156.1 lipid hydroperoxide peroxidase [Tenacibaculum sp. SG-28]
MASVTLDGNKTCTSGELPLKGTKAPDFNLVAKDLTEKSLHDYTGSTLILNIFPSIETGTCSTSVRKFNEKASALPNVIVLCISRDLPFAQTRFCGAEGIENVVMLSDYKTGAFGKSYGLEITEGIFDALHSRCVVVIDPNGNISYTEQVQEIANEPNYDAALKAL